jgi:polysaccharide chain length determinant protein (PEP-CTERM system associated)
MTTSDAPATLGQYLDILRRRRWYLLTTIPAVVLLAVFFAYFLTPSYRASSTILLEPSSIPEQLVQTTVTNWADEQIELVQRRVMSPDRLEALVKQADPYPDEPTWTVKEKANQLALDTELERVDPITLKVVGESNAFAVRYNNPSPERAALVAQQLSDLFLSYNRQTRSERAVETYDFLAAQAKSVEERIAEAEQRLAQFRAEHSDSLPETQVRNLAVSERAERELVGYESQIRVAEDRQTALNLQLSKLSPTLGTTTGNPQTELATLQGQLAEARVRYTPDHPDVKRLQRQIEALMAQPMTSAAGSGAPNNPEYLAVQSQLAAVQRELGALRAAADRARGQIYTYQNALGVAPQVEQEYSDLVRQRDVLKNQYQDVQNKLREADIARSLESEQKGARFTQIVAPGVPNSPYSPNRRGIILLGILLGVALGVVMAMLADSADQTVRGRRDLRGVAGIPTLAAVPVIENAADRRKRVLLWGSYATVVGLASLGVAVMVLTASGVFR